MHIYLLIYFKVADWLCGMFIVLLMKNCLLVSDLNFLFPFTYTLRLCHLSLSNRACLR